MVTLVKVEHTFCIEIGSRLRQERTVRKLKQSECAKLGGVSVVSQRFYESGERMPNAAYLHRLYENGFDACYILTGERKSQERLLNKKLVQEIFNVVEVWNSERSESVSTELKADIFNLFYEHFSDKKTIDQEFVKSYLKLVK